ncbi:MAG: RNA 2',3'-cyclic phosphodiesterase [Gammaproteobacteria bacterium]|nr:MAG: RNA 2',3'-cyclic phosphodiesterase [Gammaproteobacteria bacterium]
MRVFVASFLTAESAQRLVSAVPEVAGARSVPEANLHMTLHFIGEVPETSVDEICTTVTSLNAGSLKAQGLALVGFPNGRNATAVAVQLEVPERVYAWQQALAQAWPANVQSGRQRQRAFVPHVTLARSKRGIRLAQQALAGITLELEAPQAYLSETLPEGARYRALDTALG